MINNTYQGSRLDLTNVGKPTVTGITNLSLVPDSVKKNASITPAKTQAVKTTIPAKTPTSGSAGTYKGVTINSGSDADIAEQMRRVDSGSVIEPVKPVKGLLSAATPVTVSTQKDEAWKKLRGNATPTAPAAPTYQGLVGTLAERAQNPSQQVTDAFKAQQERAEALRKFRESTAQLGADINSAPTSAKVMQGRNQAIQQANFEREAALGSELTAAADLYAASLTGQGQELSALGTAAGLAAPSQAAYGQTVFNPLTGQYEGNSGLPAETMQQYAQMAANGQYASIPASITSNPVLSAQLNEAAKAINPNYNPIASAAQGQTLASNIQTGGTAQVGAAAQGYTQAIQSYNSLSAINNAAHAQAQNVQQILQTAGLNQGVQDYNKAINKISGRLGSENVTRFNTAIAEMQNMYSQILATGGGTPTGQEQTALMALNPNSSAAQINAAIQELEVAAYNKLNAQYQQAQQYQANLGAGTQPSSGGIFSW